MRLRLTLRAALQGQAIEPSREFTARVLLAAKTERGIVMKRRARAHSIRTFAKSVGYAAGLVVVAGAWFGAASNSVDAGSLATAAAKPTVAVAAPSPEEIQKAAAQIQTLAAAVNAVASEPKSLREMQHRRVARALDADLMEALAALERNPGCERASNVVTLNLKRQAQTWKALYLERTL